MLISLSFRDDEHAPAFGACIVQRLIGHARADRPIANHGNRVTSGLTHVARDSKAQRGRNRGRRMRGAKGIKLRLSCVW